MCALYRDRRLQPLKIIRVLGCKVSYLSREHLDGGWHIDHHQYEVQILESAKKVTSLILIFTLLMEYLIKKPTQILTTHTYYPSFSLVQN
jgi:hypothetical protein